MGHSKQRSVSHELLGCGLLALVGMLFAFLLIPAPALAGPVPLYLTAPFALLLLSVAIVPLFNAHWWHQNFPFVSSLLAGFIASAYLFFIPGGEHKLLHAAHEYFSFIALVGGLFFVASCIRIEMAARSSAALNMLLLAGGAVLANVVGTTGASLLLIRPYIKLNKARISPLHIVFFILIVSNCGGLLTPIGDPPLYLGYLKGIPFLWTLQHLWTSWLVVVGSLLAVFFVFDRFFANPHPRVQNKAKISFVIEGKLGLYCLIAMIAAVFIDPILAKYFGVLNVPVSALVLISIAILCFVRTPGYIKDSNEFSFEPFREVSVIFAGIFVTMIPALDYLALHGRGLGLVEGRSFYYGTGILSAVLDNAPTYLNFLQIAVGEGEINPQTLGQLISSQSGNLLLVAISTGAVFFGALTYIGNGPNFMVRAISENMGAKTPSFFGYICRAGAIAIPILILHAYLCL